MAGVSSTLVTLLGAVLLANLMAMIFLIESPKFESHQPERRVLVWTSIQKIGPQVLGTVIVNNENRGNATLEQLFLRQLQFAEIDDSGYYSVFPNFVAANELNLFSEEPLCVGIQTSLDKLHQVPDFVSTWHGHVSLALFAPGHEFFLAISAIKYLRQCYPAIKRQVSWHLAFPVGNAPNATHLPLAQLEMFDCMNVDVALALFLSTPGVAPLAEALTVLRSNMQLPYPQNLLRNVARRHCRSEWVACPDVDMVFPAASTAVQPSWTQRLALFLQSSKARECSKCAFVLPLFEVEHENRTLPINKTQLRQYVDAGRARPYHAEVFVQNQAASKLNNWIKRPQTSTVDVAYSVQYKFWYEPVFIARHSAPKFEERYIGYGMTRNTQAYEMALAGYSFYLLESIFLCHIWGLQHKNTTVNSQRKTETSMNMRFFSTSHVRELAARYDSDKFNILRYQKGRNKGYAIEMKAIKETKT